MSKREYEVPADYLVKDVDPPAHGYVNTWDKVEGEVWRAGSGGAATPFVHIQSIASTTWTVTHNLGRPPIGIMIFNDDGDEMFADVAFTTINVMTLTFSSATTGVARMI